MTNAGPYYKAKSSSCGRFEFVEAVSPRAFLWHNKVSDLWCVAMEGEAVGTDRVLVFDTPEAARLAWEINPRDVPADPIKRVRISQPNHPFYWEAK